MGIKEQIIESLTEALHNRASKGFSLSQDDCPVKTGFLKQSGSIKNEPEQSVINYYADYASIIERGVNSHTEYVRGHVSKGKFIQPHTRKVSGREGRRFIENSLKSAFKDLNNSLDASLRLRFNNVMKI